MVLTVFAIAINTWNGVQNVPRTLIEVGTAFCASQPRILRQIVLPSVIPAIMTGLRIGIGKAVVGIVIAEFFTAIGGLGGSSWMPGTASSRTGCSPRWSSSWLAAVALTGLIGWSSGGWRRGTGRSPEGSSERTTLPSGQAPRRVVVGVSGATARCWPYARLSCLVPRRRTAPGGQPVGATHRRIRDAGGPARPARRGGARLARHRCVDRVRVVPGGRDAGVPCSVKTLSSIAAGVCGEPAGPGGQVPEGTAPAGALRTRDAAAPWSSAGDGRGDRDRRDRGPADAGVLHLPRLGGRPGRPHGRPDAFADRRARAGHRAVAGRSPRDSPGGTTPGTWLRASPTASASNSLRTPG